MNTRRGKDKPALPHSAPIRNHTMLLVAVSLLMGIFIAPQLQTSPWPWLLLPLAVLLGLVQRHLGLRPYLAIGLFMAMVGLLYAQAWLHRPAPPEGQYAITGSVYGEPKIRTENRMTFYLTQVTLDGQTQPGKTYCTIYTYGGDPLPLLFDGAQVHLTGRVYHPQGKSGQHDFDYRMWLLQNGISYGVSSVRDLEIHGTPETAPWNDIAGRIRLGMRAALTRVMGEESRLAMAMLVSDREGISQDENEAFQRTGIAHVMAVSGLHVGIVGGLVQLLLGKTGLSKKWQWLLLMVALAGYCALTGFSAASLRAALMLLLASGARLAGRRSDPLVLLSTALTLVLLINPLQLFSAGLVLSFSAMGGILLLTPRFVHGFQALGLTVQSKESAEPPGLFAPSLWERIVVKMKAWGGKLAEPLSLSLAAQLGVLFPTAAYFHQLPLYGIFINLLIIPLVGLLVPLYFITLCLSWVPALNMAVGFVAKMASASLLWLVQLLSNLPYASVRVPTAPAAIMMAGALCGVLLSRYYRQGWKKRLGAMALVVVIGLSGAYFARPAPLRYVQLSVGQGDAALIVDEDQTLAIDTGAYGTELADYLLAEGRDLDALYITHLHLDHCGGISALLDAGIRIRQVYVPAKAAEQRLGEDSLALWQLLRQEGIPVEELAAGDEMRYNNVMVEALWPVREKVRRMQDANDLPLVLLVHLGGYRIFSASDLTGLYENYVAQPADVLKVAHHGSADSTGDAFLNTVSPRLGILTCAPGDQKLPAQQTLDRLASHGIPLLRTDRDGEITFTLRDGQLHAETYK